MTKQIYANYEMIQIFWSFSHFSNLAKNMRKIEF